MEGKDKSISRNLLASLIFVLEIVAYKAPRYFKAPSHTTYDGTGDLGEHLINFHAKMIAVDAEDPMLYRAFFPILAGATQRQFLSVPTYSIDKFETLADCFLIYFTSGLKVKKHFTHLSTVKQNEGET